MEGGGGMAERMIERVLLPCVPVSPAPRSGKADPGSVVASQPSWNASVSIPSLDKGEKLSVVSGYRDGWKDSSLPQQN